uniref:Phytanoyl-CoA dioxygenase domain-containing protein 1 n=1 Tax=Oikopleura dioica TaxID=34765 RepID=Q8WPL3_OIKDI|nr:CG14688-like protein [Oikopleura dioica]
MDLKQVADDFKENGLAVVKGFASAEECEAMRDEMRKICADLKADEIHCFETESGRNDYFTQSGDKIRFFFDTDAKASADDLVKTAFTSLNKVGHALHTHPGVFQDLVTAPKTKEVLRAINLKKVCVPQSMYIFKQAKFGSAVPPHQDSTFLHTSPTQTVVGLWLALEDATEDNGCLWFIPGSHKPYKDESKREKLDHAFMNRVPSSDGSVKTEYRLGTSKKYYESCDYTWVPAQVRKGDLVLIHDMVHHKSLPNHSNKSRNIYAWHLFESSEASWDSDNWLQYPEGKTFMEFETQ